MSDGSANLPTAPGSHDSEGEKDMPYFCVRCGERFSSLGDAHYPHSAALRRSE